MSIYPFYPCYILYLSSGMANRSWLYKPTMSVTYGPARDLMLSIKIDCLKKDIKVLGSFTRIGTSNTSLLLGGFSRGSMKRTSY